MGRKAAHDNWNKPDKSDSAIPEEDRKNYVSETDTYMEGRGYSQSLYDNKGGDNRGDGSKPPRRDYQNDGGYQQRQSGGYNQESRSGGYNNPSRDRYGNNDSPNVGYGQQGRQQQYGYNNYQGRNGDYHQDNRGYNQGRQQPGEYYDRQSQPQQRGFDSFRGGPARLPHDGGYQPRDSQSRDYQSRDYQPRDYQPRDYQPRDYQPRDSYNGDRRRGDKPNFPPSSGLVVFGLSFEMTHLEFEDYLTGIFSEKRLEFSCKIVLDRVTQKCRGFGFITFNSIETCIEGKKIMETAGLCAGRELRTDFSRRDENSRGGDMRDERRGDTRDDRRGDMRDNRRGDMRDDRREDRRDSY